MLKWAPPASAESPELPKDGAATCLAAPARGRPGDRALRPGATTDRGGAPATRLPSAPLGAGRPRVQPWWRRQPRAATLPRSGPPAASARSSPQPAGRCVARACRRKRLRAERSGPGRRPRSPCAAPRLALPARVRRPPRGERQSRPRRQGWTRAPARAQDRASLSPRARQPGQAWKPAQTSDPVRTQDRRVGQRPARAAATAGRGSPAPAPSGARRDGRTAPPARHHRSAPLCRPERLPRRRCPCRR